MIAGLTGMHLLIVVAVVAIIFGGAKLPIFAKNLGQSARILRREVRSLHEDDDEARPVAAPVAAQPAEAPRAEHRP